MGNSPCNGIMRRYNPIPVKAGKSTSSYITYAIIRSWMGAIQM